VNVEAAAAREDADLETASPGYASRFAGPVGAWFLELQARLTLELLAPWPGARVLDVGGGHGQLAAPLAAAGHQVTVFGSGPEALHPALRGAVRFEHGDLLHAPYPDAAFDVVLAFRLLPHAARWALLVGELCRLARRAVIVDYPTRRSVNALADPLFQVKKGVEGNTRPFLVFRDAEVEGAFAAARFRVTQRRPEFFLPMALHRGLRSAALARGLEALPRALGLTRQLGSPVILRAEPEVARG
jgi:2-polyprenyl-3-methyl-5-hydroxy-6-metoxy-1,4-benzoquinol methylase